MSAPEGRSTYSQESNREFYEQMDQIEERFREHSSTAESSPEAFELGWQIYEELVALRGGVSAQNFAEFRKQLNGEAHDSNRAILGKVGFKFDTVSVIDSSTRGILGKLPNEAYQRAVNFCQAMLKYNRP